MHTRVLQGLYKTLKRAWEEITTTRLQVYQCIFHTCHDRIAYITVTRGNKKEVIHVLHYKYINDTIHIVDILGFRYKVVM
jgi:hypothetical protein